MWRWLLLLAFTSACSATAPAPRVTVPAVDAPLKLSSGAAVLVTPTDVWAGLAPVAAFEQIPAPGGWQRRAHLRWLRRQHNAHRGFGTMPDNVVAWIDARVGFARVRAVMAELADAGFRRFEVVARSGPQHHGAYQLELAPPTGPLRASNMSLRWGPRAEAGGAFDRVEFGVVHPYRAATGDEHVWYRVLKPAHVPTLCRQNARRRQLPEVALADIAGYASRVCRTWGGHVALPVGLNATAETPWSEVMRLAAAAARADGCTSRLLYLEKPVDTPRGCLSSVITGLDIPQPQRGEAHGRPPAAVD